MQAKSCNYIIGGVLHMALSLMNGLFSLYLTTFLDACCYYIIKVIDPEYNSKTHKHWCHITLIIYGFSILQSTQKHGTRTSRILQTAFPSLIFKATADLC